MATNSQPDGSAGQPIPRRFKWLPDQFRRPVTLTLLIGSLVVAVVGLLLGWQLIVSTERAGVPAAGILFPVTLVLIFLHIVIHELGHLGAALLVGLRVCVVRIAPLTVNLDGNKIRFELHWSMTPTAGYIHAVPTNMRAFHLRRMVFILAGPLVNLSAGIACVAVASLHNQPSPFFSQYYFRSDLPEMTIFNPQNMVATCLNTAGLLGVGFWSINMTPWKSGGFSTDGAQFFDLLAGGGEPKRSPLLISLGASMSTGTRPRDWDRFVVERLLASRTGSPTDAQSNLYAYYWALDRREMHEAEEHLELALAQYEGYPLVSRSSLFLEGAYSAARYRSDVPAAFGWFAESEQGSAEEQTRCRAEAALMWARGRFSEGAILAVQGLEAIPRSVDLGGRKAEQEWLEDLLRQCRGSSVTGHG